MTKRAPLAAAMLLGLATGPALAQGQSQGQSQTSQQGQIQKAQPQPRPQLPNDQRPKAEEHDAPSGTATPPASANSTAAQGATRWPARPTRTPRPPTMA